MFVFSGARRGRVCLAVAVLTAVALMCAGAVAAETLAVAPGEELGVPASAGGAVEIELPGGGDVTIVSDPGDQLVLRVEPLGRQVAPRFEILHNGGAIRLRPEDRSSTRPARLRIRVPARFDVQLDSAGGDVRVEGVEGELWLRTQGGDIEILDCTGRVEAMTAGGDMRLEGGRLDGQIATAGGDVIVRDVEGELESATAGGDVSFAGGRSDGVLRLATSGGDVEIDQPVEELDSQTHGGDTRVRRVEGRAKLRANEGDVEIRSASGDVDAQVSGGSIELTLDADGEPARELRLGAERGSVEVIVPRGMGIQVEIELLITRRSGRDFDVTSDVPLKIDRARNWVYVDGEASKRIRATGSVGGGEHQLRITVRDGDVILRQR